MNGKSKLIFNREGTEQGNWTGTTRKCQQEGCTGVRYGVRWPDGKITWPCSKGLVWIENRAIIN